MEIFNQISLFVTKKTRESVHIVLPVPTDTMVMCVCAEIEKFKSFSRSFFVYVAFLSVRPAASVNHSTTHSFVFSLLALDIFSFLFSLSLFFRNNGLKFHPSIKNMDLVTSADENKMAFSIPNIFIKMNKSLEKITSGK